MHVGREILKSSMRQECEKPRPRSTQPFTNIVSGDITKSPFGIVYNVMSEKRSSQSQPGNFSRASLPQMPPRTLNSSELYKSKTVLTKSVRSYFRIGWQEAHPDDARK